ncbi:hypothetical protein [Caminibacter pacificus]|uniref:Uncharacterized protein n=1 Tax=Caminibacter pacificus TaxID=1424653 RepID=A0AAJ4UWZ0_9BACT|nr:hypothetical protein [Caminibacter pacificus]QDD68213.1 hypothetical protein C6V80_10180 [Caminibacter pacificus]ROR38727.1 hypothetical protein EDC58_1942 [Caminibacter pacificus]
MEKRNNKVKLLQINIDRKNKEIDIGLGIETSNRNRTLLNLSFLLYQELYFLEKQKDENILKLKEEYKDGSFAEANLYYVDNPEKLSIEIKGNPELIKLFFITFIKKNYINDILNKNVIIDDERTSQLFSLVLENKITLDVDSDIFSEIIIFATLAYLAEKKLRILSEIKEKEVILKLSINGTDEEKVFKIPYQF